MQDDYHSVPRFCFFYSHELVICPHNPGHCLLFSSSFQTWLFCQLQQQFHFCQISGTKNMPNPELCLLFANVSIRPKTNYIPTLPLCMTVAFLALLILSPALSFPHVLKVWIQTLQSKHETLNLFLITMNEKATRVTVCRVYKVH